MTRSRIDFGIDLGTTNSSIAVFTGVGADVVRNNFNSESTPSAVYFDAKGSLKVGQLAKQRLELDPENAKAEFKLEMGKAVRKEFRRSGRRLTPEELSAEVLKSLKGDVAQRLGENVEAAVITVPAAFELPQCQATRRAAELAGLRSSPLLQEPVAAALSYGFQSDKDKVFWLIYDLGGGTFDSAIIQARDGLIQVVGHAGDNELGGKQIDWAIVDQMLLPALSKRYRLEGLARGNAEYAGLIANLKDKAEEAKISLSRSDRAEILVDAVAGGRSERLSTEVELSRNDVERLAERYIVRSVNICRQLLQQTGLRADQIEKLVLVGGPTLMPYLRDRLVDHERGLGIPLDFSVDPLTVVARGAAIFAGTQRLDASAVAGAGSRYTIDLQYKAVGAEIEFLVGGKVAAPSGERLERFTIEFANAESRPPWRSGKVPLTSEGAFVTTLFAERGRPNSFSIALQDASGNARSVSPDRLSYTIGLAPTDPPLIHSIGIAKANNEVERCLQKGTPLPARKRVVLRQATEVRRGRQDAAIRIPIVEGESPKADRNSELGCIEIPASDVSRDVPAGSEVEVTLTVDQSRQLTGVAFVPVLDKTIEFRVDYTDYRRTAADPDLLQRMVRQEIADLAKLGKRAEEEQDRTALSFLDRISEEGLVEEIETSLAAARSDPDAGDKCQSRLLHLRLALDEVESRLEWPNLVQEAKEQTRETRELVSETKNPADRKLADSLEQDLQQALDGGDAEHLRKKIEALRGFHVRVLQEQPTFWIDFLEYLKSARDAIAPAGQRDQLFARADKAIRDNDLTVLQASVRQLFGMLPEEQQAEASKAFGSTVL
jgi:molecular chaperone DnaK